MERSEALLLRGAPSVWRARTCDITEDEVSIEEGAVAADGKLALIRDNTSAELVAVPFTSTQLLLAKISMSSSSSSSSSINCDSEEEEEDAALLLIGCGPARSTRSFLISFALSSALSRVSMSEPLFSSLNSISSASLSICDFFQS